MNTMPGDWTTRGTVIVAKTENFYFAGMPSRVELLRDVAECIRMGQTVTFCGMVENKPTAKHRTSLVIRAEHRGEDYMTRRANSIAVVGSTAK